ncbi:PilZ domain-containing protein [Thaumasiovibrio sp. DFM-14]|uniref:PilZ domain-containing protein n=1 Tax=Thaumasiovibrio sp. DFM-14 TaxID=3384792 RepID=UPI0039A1DB0E
MEKEEYFSVHCAVNISLEPLSSEQTLPDREAFLDEIPPLFRVASECIELEENAERELSRYGSEESKSLMKYLSVQNEKINMLLSFILLQHNATTQRYTTEAFGAGALTLLIAQRDLLSSKQWQVGSLYRINIFLDSPAAAVYCYGSITACEHISEEQAQITLRYDLIQEADRDLLIRAALHQQQKVLRRRAEARTNTTNK